ncbi:hypothetical protein [Stutzerimonas stutzeri]|uniref:hypothetical protein n=1 Tax=Stutzerimonas stutzeri TaxID=316 RepID=UPI001BCFBBD4|nr:hypothetical protein [Stutzerimonas stutzeri]
MTTNICYPYHPATGERLVGTAEFVPGVYHRCIVRIDGTINLEDGDGTAMNWDGQITAVVQGQEFLVTDSGAACLLSEVLWDPVEADQIVLEAPGHATNVTDYNLVVVALVSLQQRVELAVGALAQGDVEAASQLLSVSCRSSELGG